MTQQAKPITVKAGGALKGAHTVIAPAMPVSPGGPQIVAGGKGHPTSEATTPKQQVKE